MLGIVANFINMGMTSAQILNFLSKKVKGLAKSIDQAKNLGHGDDDILKFISGKMPKGQSKEANRNLSDQEAYLKASGLKTREEKQESKRKALSGVLGAATTALGAYGLYNKYINKSSKEQWDFTRHPPEDEQLQIEGQAQPQIGYNPGMEKGPQGPNQFQMVQPPQQLIKEAGQPGVQPLPQGTIPPSTSQPQSPTLTAPSDVIRRAKLDPLITSMAKDGQKPEDIAQYIQEAYPDHAKNIESETKEPVVNSIYRFLGKKPKKANLTQNIQQDFEKQYGPEVVQSSQNENQVQAPSSQGESTELQQRNPSEEESTKNKKGDVVLLPNGEIGTLEELKKDHAVVEVDGKKKPVKLDQIEDVPLKHKDLADLHDDLIKGIEKEIGQDVSRNVEWAGYDPKTNQLAYRPHDGSLYVYDDIGKEDVELLTSVLSQRISTGENWIGPWMAGSSSPIGAAMSKLIKKLQKERGGKGNEYSGKFQTTYHAFEPAVKAAKEKKKKKK